MRLGLASFFFFDEYVLESSKTGYFEGAAKVADALCLYLRNWKIILKGKQIKKKKNDHYFVNLSMHFRLY